MSMAASIMARRSKSMDSRVSLRASILEKSRMSLMTESRELPASMTRLRQRSLAASLVSLSRQLGHAQDRVERGADLVAHVGQERGFGPGGGVRLFHGRDQPHGLAGQLRVGPLQLAGALADALLHLVVGRLEVVLGLFSGRDVDAQDHDHAFPGRVGHGACIAGERSCPRSRSSPTPRPGPFSWRPWAGNCRMCSPSTAGPHGRACSWVSRSICGNSGWRSECSDPGRGGRRCPAGTP